ncbi:MAG: indole-3-glycerol phosphate synthase TrpC [Cyanobacteria bacterium P01_G01_bin.49]
MQIRRRPPNPAIEVDILRYQVPDPDGEARHILEEIVWHKEKEVARLRERLSLLELRKQEKNAPPPTDFLGAIIQGKTEPALIAEVKKASPSKGVIRADFDPVIIAQGYVNGGASCLSVLTDNKFFQGSFENLALVRQAVDVPLLCKEFILYPYQIYLARTKGADAILLIAAILKDADICYLIKIIQALGMTPLVEVHCLEELDRVLAIEGVSLIGINNRNLETFDVTLETTTQLLAARRDKIKQLRISIVSESGLHTPEDLNEVKQAGANAVLIGESLVRQPDLEKAIATLFSQ